MRHALVIARRELAEKRFVALAALAFAVLPFLLATIPAIRGRNGAADVIATGAGLIAIGFTGGLALVLGASIVGRDLSENRLSFYFSRPVGAPAIWFGKVTAALALILGAFLIIVLPAALSSPRAVESSWQNVPRLALIVLGGSVVLFFLAHVIGSFVRSRSAWLAFDFAAATAAGFAGYLIFQPLVFSGALRLTNALAIAVAAGFVVALIGGGAWQLERGRTDRKRSHVALSQFLWGVIGTTLLLAGVFVAWVVSATPRDLRNVYAETQASSPWAILSGRARHRMDYTAAFVYNLDTGAYSRLLPANLWRASFTEDSKSLLVWRADTRHGSAELFRRAVGDGAEVSTGLTSPLQTSYVATPAGDRIATVYGNLLSVYDVPHRQSLGSVRLPGNDVMAFYFASPSVVRIITREVRLFEFDLAHRALQQTGAYPLGTRSVIVSANEDGSRLLLRDYPRTIHVVDGRTGALQFSMRAEGVRSATLLRSGGIAYARQEGTVSIHVTDPRGNDVRVIAVPSHGLGPLNELRDGRLLFATRTLDELATMVVDPAAGTVVQRIPGAPPLSRMPIASPGDPDPRRSPIDLPRFYHTHDGKLLRWNFTTNTPEVVFPKG